jgi:hypothetical protein
MRPYAEKARLIHVLGIWWLKKEIGNFEGEGAGIEVGAIAQDNHGEVIAHKSLNGGTKSLGAAIVVVADVSVVRFQEPAESVHDCWAIASAAYMWVAGPMRFATIGEFYRCERRLHFLFAQ